MDMPKNEIRIDLRTNNKLREAVSRIPDGKKMKLEIELTKTAVEADVLRGIMQSIGIEGVEMDAGNGEKSDELETSTEEPVAVDVEAL